MASPSEVVDIGKRVASDFSEKNVSFMAAGIAYNAFVSLAPLLILVLLTVSTLGDPLESRILALAERSLPGPIADVVAQVFSGETAATGASIVGLIVLVWGTLKIFRGLDTAFSEIYETEDENSFVDQLVDGVVVLVALVISILATAAVSSVFATYADSIPYFGLVTTLVLVGGLVLAFYPMYYRFPDTDLGWREVLPGVLVAALGWAALQGIFQVYLAFKGSGSESFFGGVIVIVTWLYFSGLVLLLGAVLNAVVGGHSSGAPGGVGTGAARDPSETERRDVLDRSELTSYLRDLRQRLTGHYEEVEPESETKTALRPSENAEVTRLVGTLTKVRPINQPEGDVEVVERSRQDGDEQEWTITLSWRTDGSDRDSPEEIDLNRSDEDERGRAAEIDRDRPDATDATDATDESGPPVVRGDGAPES